MPKQIEWVFDAQVVGGPRLSASGTQVVDICDKINLVVLANEQNKLIAIPGNEVRFLAIIPGRNDALTYTGKYEVTGKDGSSTTTVTVEVASSPLDAPLILLGPGGAQSVLKALTWKEVKISNSKAVDVPIQVLVGRNF